MKGNPVTPLASPAFDARTLKPPTHIRYWVILGVAFASTAAYLTRTCISVSATTMQREFHLTDPAMGQVLAAFSVGYFVFQVPGGWAVGRWGARLTLPLLAVAWSLFSVWTGLAGSLWALLASRVGNGVAQAGLVPCSARVVMDWAPLSQRGIGSSAVACSMSLGAVIASGLTGVLLPHLGWRGVFFVYSAVGIVWAAAFYAGFRNRPESHGAVNAAEVLLIQGPPTEHEPAVKSPAGRWVDNRKVLLGMVTSSSMWALCAQAFCRAFGAMFFLTWFPAYLEQGRGVQLSSVGFLAMLPLTGTLLGNMMGGRIVDRILVRTGSRRLSRCGTAMAALALCALCTLAATGVRSPVAAVWLLALGSLFFGMGSPAAWAVTMDISGKHTPVVFGIMNMSGNLGAFVCPILLGYLIAYIKEYSADWNLVLYLFVGVYVAGALCWAALNPHRSAVERATA